MRVGVNRSSGFIGSALVAALHERGDDVVRFVRPASPHVDETSIDGTLHEVSLTRTICIVSVHSIDAVINLAGAGIADRRWTSARREEDSTFATRRDHTAGSGSWPANLTRRSWRVARQSASTDRAATSPSMSRRTSAMISSLGSARSGEEATVPLEHAGTTVAHLRTGIVMSSRGGSLKRQLPLFRVGLGGALGSGAQWISPISLRDEVRAILWLLDVRLTGPFNLVAPAALTNRSFSSALALQLRRPAASRCSGISP